MSVLSEEDQYSIATTAANGVASFVNLRLKQDSPFQEEAALDHLTQDIMDVVRKHVTSGQINPEASNISNIILLSNINKLRNDVSSKLDNLTHQISTLEERAPRLTADPTFFDQSQYPSTADMIFEDYDAFQAASDSTGKRKRSKRTATKTTRKTKASAAAATASASPSSQLFKSHFIKGDKSYYEDVKPTEDFPEQLGMPSTEADLKGILDTLGGKHLHRLFVAWNLLDQTRQCTGTLNGEQCPYNLPIMSSNKGSRSDAAKWVYFRRCYQKDCSNSKKRMSVLHEQKFLQDFRMGYRKLIVMVFLFWNNRSLEEVSIQTEHKVPLVKKWYDIYCNNIYERLCAVFDSKDNHVMKVEDANHIDEQADGEHDELNGNAEHDNGLMLEDEAQVHSEELVYPQSPLMQWNETDQEMTTVVHAEP